MQYSTVILSALLSALSMPMIIGYAQRNNLYDATGGRKIHSGKVPRLGGVGMYWAFVLVMALFVTTGRAGFHPGASGWLKRMAPLAVGSLVMHLLGLADDFKPLSAKLKFAVQGFVALVLVALGFRFRSLGFHPGLPAGLVVELVVAFISWGWIVGVTNAINLIDGMDGLAGGVSAIAASACAGFHFFAGDVQAAVCCLAVAGVVLGFLVMNFPAPRARIFMGDSGSLFLGFMLAVMPFMGSGGATSGAAGAAIQGHSIGLVPAIALLALPITDTLRAIVRRRLAGVHFGTPDRRHIHHLLLDRGHSTRTILAMVYFLGLLQAVLFILASSMSPAGSWLILLISLASTGGFFVFAGAGFSMDT
jgi:UDP-GlcNAc:undecaprenyl-phosphate GlcNAc-1-phosphate transferase